MQGLMESIRWQVEEQKLTSKNQAEPRLICVVALLVYIYR